MPTLGFENNKLKLHIDCREVKSQSINYQSAFKLIKDIMIKKIINTIYLLNLLISQHKLNL